MSVLDGSVAGGPAIGAPVPGATPPARARAGVLRRLVGKPLAVVSLVFVAVVVVLAVLAPVLTSQSPTASHIADALAPMGGAHPLGTDGTGRDLLSELLYGARTSLVGALIVVAVSLVLGLPTGLLAGYFRGWFDGVASWVSSLLMALPAIIVLLVVLAQWGRSTVLAMTVFGVIITPAVFRLIRASVIGVRGELYVDAARVSGLGDTRIMRRHILPVVVAPTVIQVSQLLGVGIVVQAGLEFLGLGSANQASWGGMLSDAFQNIYTAPLLLLWPGLAIVLTVTAFSLIGNALRDALGVGGTGSRVRGRRDVVASGPVITATGETTHEVAVPEGLLVIRGLRVSYPRPDAPESVVVQDVSLTVHRGEILGLVGESGSGKSQTAFSVLGLLPPGPDVGRPPVLRRRGPARDLPGSDEPAPRLPHRLHPAGADVATSTRRAASAANWSSPMRHHLGLSRAAGQGRGAAAALPGRHHRPGPGLHRLSRIRSRVAWPSAC